jgi:TetR/AcrR family tetracycline transcriptional repressor
MLPGRPSTATTAASTATRARSVASTRDARRPAAGWGEDGVMGILRSGGARRWCRRDLNGVHLNAVHYSGGMARAGATGRHTREDVARTALRILDEHGLPDFTMRRLAAALDVQPSALYWHFPDKQSLLAELADRIVAEARDVRKVDRPASSAWTGRVRHEAIALRTALLAHRDGAEVVASTTALGLGASAARDALSSAVAEGGLCYPKD